MACPNNFAPHFAGYHYGSSPSLPAPATAGDELLHGPAALHINKINKDVKTRSEKVHKRGNACFSRSSRCSTRSCKHIRLHNFPSFSGGLGLISQLGLTPCLHLFGMPFDVSCIISSEPSTLRSQPQCRPQCFAVAGLCLVTDLQDCKATAAMVQLLLKCGHVQAKHSLLWQLWTCPFPYRLPQQLMLRQQEYISRTRLAQD